MRNAGLEEAQAESRLPGEISISIISDMQMTISITSDMQVTPPLWQRVKN